MCKGKLFDLFLTSRMCRLILTSRFLFLFLLQAREAERALLLYEEMQEKGMETTVHTYGAVISACALRYDMHLRTFEVLADMRRRGLECDERIVAMLLHRCAIGAGR